MMCENCAYSELCIHKVYGKGNIIECDHYKDKSLFRNLQYKIGDIVHLVSQKGGLNVMWYVFEAKVIGFHIDDRNNLEIRVKCTNTSVDMTGYYREEFIFTNSADAEKKLNELSKLIKGE